MILCKLCYSELNEPNRDSKVILGYVPMLLRRQLFGMDKK